MESPSPAAAEPGAPEAPLAAERVGCARPPPKSEHAEHQYQGHRGRHFSIGTGCAQPRSPAQASEGPGTGCSLCTSKPCLGAPCAAPSRERQQFGIPSGPQALALLLSIL